MNLNQHSSPKGRRNAALPGISMASLAIQLGISPSHLSDVVNGRKKPSPSLKVKLAQALGWGLDQLDNQLGLWAIKAGQIRRQHAKTRKLSLRMPK